VPFYGSSHNPEFIAQGGTMARNAARLKMGYYPLPVSEAARLRSLLNYSGPASVVDPCVGQGTALEIIMQGTEARRYGVELDAERAANAQSKGIETIQGNAFDAVAKPESFSLLYLNPPYDSEIGQVANNRMERLFLDHTYRWLAMDGVLAMVIPFERLMDCAGLLSSHFTALNVFRMTDEESVRFRQIAVLGVRNNVRGSAIDANKRLLQRIGLYGSYQELPELAPDAYKRNGSQLPWPALRPARRPAAALRRLEAGHAVSRSTRRGSHWATDHASAWRPCRVALHGGSIEWRLWPGRRPAHCPLAVGQAHHHLRRARRGKRDCPSPRAVGQRIAAGLRRWKNAEVDRNADPAGGRYRCRMRTCGSGCLSITASQKKLQPGFG
jgi:hypothetical protein